jgi:hypothetical protein
MGFGLTPGADTDNYAPVAVDPDVDADVAPKNRKGPP